MTARFAVTMWLTVKGPDRAAHFEDVVGRYADIESDHDGLLDCAWSLDDKEAHGDVEVELTVAAPNEAAAVALANASVRAAIQRAGGYTPGWDDAVPDLAVVYRLANEEVTVLDAA